jgi:tetratricopeptide (TPR) repeat protein
MTTHLWIHGGRGDERQAAGDPGLRWHSCHRQLRGPFSGLAPVLIEIVPQLQREAPELIAEHHAELTAIVPELAELIGIGPRTLVEITPHEERTRYYGNTWIRGLSHGLISLLMEYARRRGDDLPWQLAFDRIEEADMAEQEFLASLLRRCDPAVLRVTVGTAGEVSCAELGWALTRYASKRPPATVHRPADDRTVEHLLANYIASDGTSDDPAELAAYSAAASAVVAPLHDARAAALAVDASWGLRTGAIPYHLERGSDPTHAGRQALREAIEFCLSVGYSTATLDIGLRGRQVSDPVEHQQDYSHFTAKAASALVQIQRFDEAEVLYRDLMRRYGRARVHMTCYYALAMLHTRFYTPRNHDLALELINTARALASLESDPIDGVFFQVYEDNGAALIEMHRGNLELAHKLVDDGISRIDRELPADRYLVHRTQLVHNRARVLVALRRYQEAYRDFCWLLEVDPFYVEYHLDRANLRRKLNDPEGALADYTRAIEVSAPFSGLFYNRANIYIERGELELAIADLRLAVEIDRDFADGWTNLGMCLLDRDDPEGAALAARAGLEFCPDDADLRCVLGLAEQACGNSGAARRALDQVLSSHPRHEAALIYRASVNYENGRYGAAIADLTTALAVNGSPNADLLLNRGLARHANGQLPEAIADFDLALEQPSADRATLLFHRAAARRDADELGAADADLAALLAEPESELHQAARELLHSGPGPLAVS